MPITEGPPSLEVAHLWNGSAYLNDRWDGAGGKNWAPHVALTDMAVTKEIPDTTEPNQGRRGSFAYPTSVKSVTYEYEGVLRSQTLPGLRALEGGLNSTFRDVQDLGTMVLLGDPAWFYTARVMDIDIPKGMVGGPKLVWPFQQKFGLTLKLLDPRAYLLIPATAGPFAAGSHVLANDGLIDTDPTFTFPSFAGGSLIGSNTTLGVGLRFDDLPAGAATLSFSTQRLTVGGVDFTGRLTPSSRWWDENEQGLVKGGQSVTWNTAWSAVWFNGAGA